MTSAHSPLPQNQVEGATWQAPEERKEGTARPDVVTYHVNGGESAVGDAAADATSSCALQVVSHVVLAPVLLVSGEGGEAALGHGGDAGLLQGGAGGNLGGGRGHAGPCGPLEAEVLAEAEHHGACSMHR